MCPWPPSTNFFNSEYAEFLQTIPEIPTYCLKNLIFWTLNVLKIDTFENAGKDAGRTILEIRLIKVLKIWNMGSISIKNHDTCARAPDKFHAFPSISGSRHSWIPGYWQLGKAILGKSRQVGWLQEILKYTVLVAGQGKSRQVSWLPEILMSRGISVQGEWEPLLAALVWGI